MAYIYKITNDVNEKVYIGKTHRNINKRFAQHCADAFKITSEKRPLYIAMRKYGVEHFHISLIEETDRPEEREIYWIEKTQSFYKGYNATMGGDGKHYIDYEPIIKVYKEVLNMVKTAEICNVSKDTVKIALKNNHIPIKGSDEIAKEKLQKTVGMYDLNNRSCLIMSFPSTREAARYLIENEITASPRPDGVCSHITQVCNNKRNSAYGFFWQYMH